MFVTELIGSCQVQRSFPMMGIWLTGILATRDNEFCGSLPCHLPLLLLPLSFLLLVSLQLDQSHQQFQALVLRATAILLPWRQRLQRLQPLVLVRVPSIQGTIQRWRWRSRREGRRRVSVPPRRSGRLIPRSRSGRKVSLSLHEGRWNIRRWQWCSRWQLADRSTTIKLAYDSPTRNKKKNKKKFMRR